MYLQHVRCFLRIADAGTSVKTDCLAFVYRFRSANLSVIFDVMIWLNYTQRWWWFTFRTADIVDWCPKKKITQRFGKWTWLLNTKGYWDIYTFGLVTAIRPQSRTQVVRVVKYIITLFQETYRLIWDIHKGRSDILWEWREECADEIIC